MEALDSVVREAVMVVAILTLPVLGIATAIGTLVAIAQAATQVQEQTLVLLPKMLAVGLLVTACGNFGMHLCAALFEHALSVAPLIARGG